MSQTSESLDSPDFNVTEWINKRFPNGNSIISNFILTSQEESLVNVDSEVENIRAEIKKCVLVFSVG
jgi:hypothetical protein